MERLLIWPANPAASILALWLISQVFLYFARVPMHKGLDEIGRLLGGALRICARWCRGMATRVTQRDREMILERDFSLHGSSGGGRCGRLCAVPVALASAPVGAHGGVDLAVPTAANVI